MANLNYKFSNENNELSTEDYVHPQFQNALEEGETMLHLEVTLDIRVPAGRSQEEWWAREGYTHLEGSAPRVLSSAQTKCYPYTTKIFRLALPSGCMIKVEAYPESNGEPSILVAGESGEVRLEG
jgi:hypothetical protein